MSSFVNRKYCSSKLCFTKQIFSYNSCQFLSICVMLGGQNFPSCFSKLHAGSFLGRENSLKNIYVTPLCELAVTLRSC